MGYNCFTCDTPKQVALAEYLNDADAYLALGQMIQTKRDYFRNKMAGTSFTCIPSHGSYFECYNYAAISNEPDTEFAKRLTIDYGVATIPVSAFYRDKKDDKVVRFCFAKKETTLDLAIEKLKLL